MSRIVIFPMPLLLREVRRNEDGSLKSGYVINGDWNFEIRNGEHLAKAENRIVNRWPAYPITEVAVPDGMKCNYTTYNEVIEWARTQLPKEQP